MSILEAIPVVAEFFSCEEADPDSWRSGLHSGNLGDILYSLPTCRALDINHLILNVCADPAFGGRVLSEQATRALVPLLLAQGFILRVTIIKSGVPWEYANPRDLGVDYVLDSFRATFTNPWLHLVYAHAVPFNLMVDGARPWITIDGEAPQLGINQQPYIVVSLTGRYRRYDHAYYEYLFRDVPADRVFFVGVGNDQIERRNIGGTVFQTTDFADLARLLANAALFIGNPSFTYALAEGLKVNRLVEVPEDNNVYPLDGSGSLLHMSAPENVRAKIFEALQLEDYPQVAFENAIPGYVLANMPYVQLLFDTGSGFNEIESIAAPVVKGRRQYVFNKFPQDATIRTLRFDPLNDHTVVRINHIKLSSQAGEQTLNAVPLNATHVDASELYFAHIDPQFLIDVPEQFQTGIKEIIVDMEIIALGPAEAANRLYACHFESLAAARCQLATDLGAISAKHSQLTIERDQLATERAHLITEREVLVVERGQLLTERGGWGVEKNRLLVERDEILRSRSWRITAPLRWLVRRFMT
ncbi:hypothetical protein SAMN02787142_2452 [Burkholderia sp. WP9]|uniref:hypothetical protein n=1 Tax=Burkholderia sp. WP9 TaxID=1500263 RepID=UPI0008971AB9|nr:hypothetical protein [Burkholderia sp. WP9]SED05398.1 hypothetical protein SAMN02787142_2452 [Burkholderia sp. WP9]